METAARAADGRQATRTTDGYLKLADQAFGASRQRLISYLVKLNLALEEGLPDLSQALLARFCDSLVDYLSEGHFRVFQRLPLPPPSYARIEATTQAGMAFNDRFGALAEVPMAALRQSLEELAQVLTRRFELEDEVLGAEPR